MNPLPHGTRIRVKDTLGNRRYGVFIHEGEQKGDNRAMAGEEGLIADIHYKAEDGTPQFDQRVAFSRGRFAALERLRGEDFIVLPGRLGIDFAKLAE